MRLSLPRAGPSELHAEPLQTLEGGRSIHQDPISYRVLEAPAPGPGGVQIFHDDEDTRDTFFLDWHDKP
jgi:hypothetical protein